jgi:hypothetical protein
MMKTYGKRTVKPMREGGAILDAIVPSAGSQEGLVMKLTPSTKHGIAHESLMTSIRAPS